MSFIDPTWSLMLRSILPIWREKRNKSQRSYYCHANLKLNTRVLKLYINEYNTSNFDTKAIWRGGTKLKKVLDGVTLKLRQVLRFVLHLIVFYIYIYEVIIKAYVSFLCDQHNYVSQCQILLLLKLLPLMHFNQYWSSSGAYYVRNKLANCIAFHSLAEKPGSSFP
jgi:hypothetical protein